MKKLFLTTKNKISNNIINRACKHFKKKEGALNMVEIIIILVIVVALAVIFQDILKDIIDSMGASVKTAVEGLFTV